MQQLVKGGRAERDFNLDPCNLWLSTSYLLVQVACSCRFGRHCIRFFTHTAGGTLLYCAWVKQSGSSSAASFSRAQSLACSSMLRHCERGNFDDCLAIFDESWQRHWRFGIQQLLGLGETLGKLRRDSGLKAPLAWSKAKIRRRRLLSKRRPLSESFWQGDMTSGWFRHFLY